MTSATITPELRADVLVEAIPYLARFAGSRIVVKYGGNALADADEQSALRSFADDVLALRSVGVLPVVVHGGGPQIGEMMRRLDMEPEFRDGLRVTDAATLDVARMVLVGKVNREIVGAINAKRSIAVGLSGEDAGLIGATRRTPDIGFVGDVGAVDTTILDHLLSGGFIPVIATIGTDVTGQAYNINADTAAGAIAEALRAEKLVFLTDVEGIRADYRDPSTLLSQLNTSELEALMAQGTVAGGMVPKARAALEAVKGGVAQAHILDGRAPHVLLLEFFTRSGIGTMVVP